MSWFRRRNQQSAAAGGEGDVSATAGGGGGGRDKARGKRRFRLVLAGTGLLVVAASPFWGPLLLRRMDFFRVRRVELRGTYYLAAADVVGKLGLDSTRSVWDPTSDIERQVGAHPQVRSVRVRRELPGTLVIEIDERLPVALVPSPQGFRAYDERGVPLPIEPSRIVVDAPIVRTPDTLVFRLLADMRRGLPRLYDRLSEARRSGQREVVLQLDAVPIRTMVDVTLERLAEIELVERDLARRLIVPAELDLRFKDQVIARLP